MSEEAPQTGVEQQVSQLSIEPTTPTTPDSTPSTPTGPDAPKPKSKFAAFGGGGQKCTVCDKTSYPAETVQFEMKPYHVDCFSCVTCKKKLEAFQAAQFEDSIYCRSCFAKQGLNRKQSQVVWESKPAHERKSSTLASSLGGGGMSCSICQKTAYPAETVLFEQKPYHQSCFSCTCCKKLIEQPSNAAEFEDQVYCKVCFQKEGLNRKQANVQWKPTESKTNALASKFGGGGHPCSKCAQTVYSGEAVSYDQKVYHAKCMTCSDCSKEIVVSETNKFEDNLYCKTCWARGQYAQKQRDTAATPRSEHKTNALASKFGGGGHPCSKCAQTVYSGEAVSYDQKVYHAKCMTCSDCSKEIVVSETNKFEDNLYCKTCWARGQYAQKQRDAHLTSGEKPKAAVNPRFANLGGGGTKCHICTKTVYPAETIMFEKRAYHAQCFKCTHCSVEIQQLAQAENKEDKAYCKKCFMELGLWQADK